MKLTGNLFLRTLPKLERLWPDIKDFKMLNQLFKEVIGSYLSKLMIRMKNFLGKLFEKQLYFLKKKNEVCMCEWVATCIAVSTHNSECSIILSLPEKLSN